VTAASSKFTEKLVRSFRRSRGGDGGDPAATATPPATTTPPATPPPATATGPDGGSER